MAIRITYDSKTVDLDIAEKALAPNYLHKYNRNMSCNGKSETINEYGYQEHSFESYFTASTYKALIAWWSWAREGNLWSFAFDSDNAQETTLIFDAAAGQKIVYVNSLGAFDVGDACYLRSTIDDRYEVVTIAATSGPGGDFIVDSDGTFIVDSDGTYLVSGTGGSSGYEMESNLAFSYSAGDTFRHWDYWPEVFSLDVDFNPSKTGNYYKHLFRFAVLN